MTAICPNITVSRNLWKQYTSVTQKIIKNSLKKTLVFKNFIKELEENWEQIGGKFDENLKDKIVTNTKIKYSQIGKVDNEGVFITIREKQNALLYILNNIFRKNEFRDGQLAIIDRALQGKDVIGILPTGSGKSLTYQICTLLQP